MLFLVVLLRFFSVQLLAYDLDCVELVLPLGNGIEASFMPLLSLLSYDLLAAFDVDALHVGVGALAGEVVTG